MITNRRASLDKIRAFHVKMMAAASNSTDERFERIFELVRREVFLGPGPWQVMAYNRRYLETPNADPAFLYQNVVVALDATKGINNGEPFLHAAWIGAASPKAGETVIHVGEDLASRARQNLEPFEGVSVIDGDATVLPLPKADLIYVNAGVIAPPSFWLSALRPGGRIIFPWQANETTGVAVLLTRSETSFTATPMMPVWFIPCVGASDSDHCTKAPSMAEAWSIRSVWLTRDRSPDDSAVAIYKDLWFSGAIAQ
jgi:protein-L-isoaspartate(D-aspartate) O-methyltransferase